MALKNNVTLFSATPRTSCLLALLFIVLGVIAINGVLPVSENRKYFPGHDWFLALISWATAVIFGYCGLKGLSWIQGHPVVRMGRSLTLHQVYCYE